MQRSTFSAKKMIKLHRSRAKFSRSRIYIMKTSFVQNWVFIAPVEERVIKVSSSGISI